MAIKITQVDQLVAEYKRIDSNRHRYTDLVKPDKSLGDKVARLTRQELAEYVERTS